MKLKYVLTPIVIFLVLVIVFSARPPETVSYYEIEHGVKVDSSTPNVMDAFTVQAYLRNNNPRTVQVEPFRYQFDIIDIRRVDYHVDTILKQEKPLRIRPDETIIIHQEIIYPDTNRTYHISALGEETTLTVEGWDTGLSKSISMSKHGVQVSLKKYMFADETPRLTIRNNRGSGISIGVGYRLEHYINGSWRRYSPTTPDGDFFILVGISIQPGGVYRHDVPISHLEDGYYRVKKTVYFGNQKNLDYLVEFQKSIHAAIPAN
jgi:hypothetical protein